MLALLLACAVEAGQDSAPSGSDSGADDTGIAPSAAWAAVSGAPADGLGNAVDGAGDLDGDGDDDLLVAAYLGNRVCALLGPLAAGEQALDTLPTACFVGEEDTDYAGYGMGPSTTSRATDFETCWWAPSATPRSAPTQARPT